nr:PIN domain-containing protein [Nocardia sp. XZ_19_385]
MNTGQLDKREVLSRYLNSKSAVVFTTVHLLELLFTAPSPRQWDQDYAEFARHPVLHHTGLTHLFAIDIQHRLWHSGKTRAAGCVDVVIAAIAVQHHVTVVHYDTDFEHIKTVVPEFDHEWVAPKGTL